MASFKTPDYSTFRAFLSPPGTTLSTMQVTALPELELDGGGQKAWQGRVTSGATYLA